MTDHVWELRNPDGGMNGLEFARALMADHVTVLAHALPERVDVEVRDADGRRVAVGEGLNDPSTSAPMAVLSIDGGGVTRRNLWPDDQHLGLPVILPGGEVGILLEWRHAEDRSAWRWRVEFANAVKPTGVPSA
jgi:hypothetical protein